MLARSEGCQLGDALQILSHALLIWKNYRRRRTFIVLLKVRHLAHLRSLYCIDLITHPRHYCSLFIKQLILFIIQCSFNFLIHSWTYLRSALVRCPYILFPRDFLAGQHYLRLADLEFPLQRQLLLLVNLNDPLWGGRTWKSLYVFIRLIQFGVAII